MVSWIGRTSIGALCGCLYFVTGPSLLAQESIRVIDRGDSIPHRNTVYDTGPCVGNILNAHYFPGLKFYRHANFKKAKNEFDYVILRPHYTVMNPKQAEIMSTAHFLRGVIYFNHAEGLGRLTLAKKDFERAIKWNALNHGAYIQLARLLGVVNRKDHAIKVLNRLLEAKPEPEIERLVKEELATLEADLRANKDLQATSP